MEGTDATVGEPIGRSIPRSVSVRTRLLAVGTSYAIFALLADLLRQGGSLTPPGGGFGIQILWFAAALAAARRPVTSRFAWLVVLSAAADVVPELEWTDNDVVWIIGNAWGALGTVVFAHMIVAFPTGRLQSSFDRRLIAGLYAYWLVFGLIWIAVWTPQGCFADGYCPHNPFVLVPNRAFGVAMGQGTSLLAPLLGALIAISVGRRWRASTAAGRRILLPVVVAIPFAYADQLTRTAANLIGADGLGEFLSNPIVLLWSWILPGLFLIGVIRAQLAWGAVADLAVRLGRGVAPGMLRDALGRALGDPMLEVVFPAPSGDGLVGPAGKRATLPDADDLRAVYRLEGDSGLVAALVYDGAIDAEDPGRVERVAAIARLAIENERLTAQVRAQLDEVRESRARIVQATDDERRRVERDLHDGAQQRLVALAMHLQLARDTVSSVPALVDSATSELQAAIAEVRNLARGLFPTILTEAGLAAALETLAEQSAVPVRVSAPGGRFPGAVEAAAYFVVSEALTNVARYSDATVATVTVTEGKQEVEVVIADDGRGGADPTSGTGLRGLEDRVAALGGSFVVSSPPGAGTTLTAKFPIP